LSASLSSPDLTGGKGSAIARTVCGCGGGVGCCIRTELRLNIYSLRGLAVFKRGNRDNKPQSREEPGRERTEKPSPLVFAASQLHSRSNKLKPPSYAGYNIYEERNAHMPKFAQFRKNCKEELFTSPYAATITRKATSCDQDF